MRKEIIKNAGDLKRKYCDALTIVYEPGHTNKELKKAFDTIKESKKKLPLFVVKEIENAASIEFTGKPISEEYWKWVREQQFGIDGVE